MTKDEVLEKIKIADKMEIHEYMEAALKRYRKMYSQWDIHYIAIPKRNKEQRRIVTEYIINALRNNITLDFSQEP